MFGSLVKQYQAGQTADEADWLIGDGLFTSAVSGVALRSMKDPGTAYDDPVLGRDPQPAHLRDYVRTLDDNGGVHINSGIPNKAFYLVASALGGHAWERAGQIWYDTLLDPRLPARVGFRGFARLTAQNAARLYGLGSDELRATREAWAEVGVLPSPEARRSGGLARLADGDVGQEVAATRPWAVDGDAPAAAVAAAERPKAPARKKAAQRRRRS